MTPQEINTRNEWRALNIQINSAVSTMKTNEKAGYRATDEYKVWLNNLIEYRNILTDKIID